MKNIDINLMGECSKGVGRHWHAKDNMRVCAWTLCTYVAAYATSVRGISVDQKYALLGPKIILDQKVRMLPRSGTTMAYEGSYATSVRDDDGIRRFVGRCVPCTFRQRNRFEVHKYI